MTHTSTINNHFKSAFADFNALKSNNQIPPQMLIKLEYLLVKILPSANNSNKTNTNSQASSKQFEELPEYEKLSLDQISKETGLQLFINIINCLSGKDVVLYVRDEKMYIRKDQALTMWTLCYGTIDNNKIIVYKKPLRNDDNSFHVNTKHKPIHEMEFSAMKISKNFKEYKRKSVFGINHKNKQSYLVGFDQQSACARIHELLRNLIKEKMRKNRDPKSISKMKEQDTNSEINSSKKRKYSNSQQEGQKDEEYYTSQLSYRESLNNEDSNIHANNTVTNNINIANTNNQLSFKKKIINQKQYEYQQVQPASTRNSEKSHQSYHQAVLQYIKKQELLCDQSFRLVRNNEYIRQLTHKTRPNVIKQFITVNNIHDNTNIVEAIMELYLLQNQWNQEVEEISIDKRLDDNVYEMGIRVKKYSYLSWNRSCKIYCVGLKKDNVGYLVMRDTEVQIENNDVAMSWNQIIEIRYNEQTNKVYMIILSEFDFKGYSSLEDSQKMGLKVMQNADKFPNFAETQIVLKKEKNMFKLSSYDKNDALSNEQDKRKIASKKSKEKVKNRQRTLSVQSDFELNQQNINNNIQQSEKQNSEQKPNEEQKLEFQKSTSNDKQPTVASAVLSSENMATKLLETRLHPTESLLEELRVSKLPEIYYLKHYFDQNPKLDLSRSLHEVETIDNYINQGGIYTIRDNGDLVFYDQKTIQLQKDVLKLILKQLGSNLMSGKSIMNMSLPVEIFDDKAILERVAMGYGYAPLFLTEAGDTDDITKQAELVILTIMGILPLHLNVTKPFNPILGQTFECTIAGIPIYMQQISHHPPISALYMKGDNFIFHGSFHSYADMGLNQVNGRNLCPLFVQFPKTNTFYEIKMNDMEITGIMYGDRVYRGAGKAFVYEKTNNIFAEYSYGKEKKKVYEMPKGDKITPNTVLGGIYSVTENFGKKFMKCQNKRKFDGLKPDDIISKHTQIRGHWGLDMYFNGKLVKTLKNPIPNKICHPEYVLPSDSNFRLDLLYKRMNKLKTANQQKQVLENIQRRDRKLREGKGILK